MRGKPTTKMIDEAADKLAFAAHFVGLEISAANGGAGATVASPR